MPSTEEAESLKWGEVFSALVVTLLSALVLSPALPSLALREVLVALACFFGALLPSPLGRVTLWAAAFGVSAQTVHSLTKR